MEPLDILVSRQSCGKLTEPAPEGQALDNILAAGLRAPDHAGLSPWRFMLYQGDARAKLGEIYALAARRENPDCDPSVLDRAHQLPQRAPIVIVAIASPTYHAKVPEVEQIMSAGCAVMAMQQAAQAQGFNGMWRTGTYAYSDTVKCELGLKESESIVGFLYLGTPEVKLPQKPARKIADYVEYC